MSARDWGRAGLLVLAIVFALRVAAAAPPIEEIRQAVRTGDIQRVKSLLNEHGASLAGSDLGLLHEAAAAGVRRGENVTDSRPRSERHEEVGSSLPDDLKPAFDALVADYQFAAAMGTPFALPRRVRKRTAIMGRREADQGASK